MSLFTPDRINRRRFLGHVTTAAATLPAAQFIAQVGAHAAAVQSNQKACILIWLGGGPPTIDMWDLKPDSRNAGEFRPIDTRGDMQISDQMPLTAQVMDQLSLVRSMSTREADHLRGRYYLHTSFIPNPTVVHPAFGSVVSYEIGTKRSDLQIPAFVSIGSAGEGAGYLGMTHAPFVVDSNGRIRDADMQGTDDKRLGSRLDALAVIEKNFIESRRGELPQAHREVYSKAVSLMKTDQLKAFRVDEEKPETRETYGNNELGRGLLLARRLVETGVPFVEVVSNGWDLHSDNFRTLREQRLPQLDKGIAAITTDLKDRGLLDHVTLVCMGEFGRTPRINQNAGRDHWATSWSVLIGGGGLKGGQAVGQTDDDGMQVVGKSYLPGDIWATVAHALGIPPDTVHQSKNRRPMKLANGGRPIDELIG